MSDDEKQQGLDSVGLFQLGYDPEDVGRALVATRGHVGRALELLQVMPDMGAERSDTDSSRSTEEPELKRARRDEQHDELYDDNTLVGHDVQLSKPPAVRVDSIETVPTEPGSIGEGFDSPHRGDAGDMFLGGSIHFDGGSFTTVPPSSASRGRSKLIPASLRGTKAACSCSRSGCLKRYCVCFAAGNPCNPNTCGCTGCENDDSTDERRAKRAALMQAKRAGEARIVGEGNDRSHKVGCKCKRSGCTKGYCECFQAGIKCGDKCKCTDCKNHDGAEHDGSHSDWSVLDERTPRRVPAGVFEVSSVSTRPPAATRGSDSLSRWSAEHAAAAMVDLVRCDAASSTSDVF